MTITYFFCSVLMLEMNSISSKDIHIFTCSANGDKSANEMHKCQNPQKLIFSGAHPLPFKCIGQGIGS